MNQDHLPSEAERRFDERAAELNREFRDHLQEFREAHPELEPINRERVFAGWMIQKVAGLQILVEDLYRALDSGTSAN